MFKRSRMLLNCLPLAAAASMLLSPVSNALEVLETTKLRFGTGSENSINSTGTLQQPFYWESVGSTFYPLTFSNYPLDVAIGLGGDGTSDWNTNGTIVNSQDGTYSLTSLVIDTSGFIRSSGDKGYGTLISTGTANIGGSDLQVKNTYSLGQNDSFISITTEVTNVSGSNVQNLRVWVGTRDDYVGQDDDPIKRSGNLVNGAFQQISTPSEQAQALLIEATAGASTPGVLFYSTDPRADISVNNCCSFVDAYTQDPATSPAVTPSNDGSYAMFVRMPDLANNEKAEFTWYYAAGALSDITNVIAAVASASGSVSNITYTSADFAATVTENSTGYYIVVERDATAPTSEQIKAGVSYSSVTVIASGSRVMTADVEETFNLNSLTVDTDYDIYFVAENSTPAFSDINKTPFSTLAYPDDGDGVDALVEMSAPNSGDANGDSRPDETQSNVTSLVTSSGGEYITVEVDGACASMQSVSAINPPTSDPSGYQFPLGMVQFTLPCETADVTFYVHGLSSPNGIELRKYGPTPPSFTTSSWYSMPGVTYGTANIGGQTVATVSYSLTDGALGDDTGDDGVIIDPVGIGFGTVSGIPTMPFYGMLLTMLGLGWVAHRKLTPKA